MAAANSEAGTTSSPAVIAVRDPSWNCLRHLKKLVGVDVVQTSDMRDGHTGLKGLLHNGDLFLRSPASTAIGSC